MAAFIYLREFKTHIPLLIAIAPENNEKYIFKRIFNLLNLTTLRNGKVQNKKFNRFQNKYLKLLLKYFIENGKEKLSPNDSFFKQLEKCQKEYYPENLNLTSFCSLTILELIIFPISLLKRNLPSYWKWQTLEGKIWPVLMTSKNRDLFCFLYLLSRWFFFKNI